jgi:folate-binding protein YgfZ
LAFFADGGASAVAGVDHRVFRELHDFAFYRLHDLVQRSAPQIGAADASGKQGVAGEELRHRRGAHFSCFWRQVERDAAGGMSGSVHYLERKRSPLQNVTVLEELIDLADVGSRNAQEVRLDIHVLVEREVVAMHHHRSAGVLVELAEAADVVDVGVSADDGLHCEVMAAEEFQDTADFVTGIDHQGFVTFGVGDDGAVALEHANRDGDLEKSFGQSICRGLQCGFRIGFQIGHWRSIAFTNRRQLHPGWRFATSTLRDCSARIVEALSDATAAHCPIMETTDSFDPVIHTPLGGLHKARGAHMGVWFGCELPGDFGDVRKEFFFAKQSVALLDKNYRSYFSFGGPDRVRYLNAILTNNIKDLKESHGVVSLLLNPQGHILAEIETYAKADKLFCISYNMIREKLVETLDKFIIMDDVSLSDESGLHCTLALEGPASAQIVSELTSVDLATVPDLGIRDVRVGSLPCVLIRRSPGGTFSADFVTTRTNMRELWDVLQERARAAGGGPAGYSALSALRLEQGVPWFSYDFGEKQIPHEAGLQDSHISYTKGCYTGQEIVERVRSRGQVNRRRVRLAFSTDIAPAAETVLTLGGKEVGVVTRAATPPDASTAIGMGYVRKEGNAVGTQLNWSGGTATVS